MGTTNDVPARLPQAMLVHGHTTNNEICRYIMNKSWCVISIGIKHATYRPIGRPIPALNIPI